MAWASNTKKQYKNTPRHILKLGVLYICSLILVGVPAPTLADSYNDQINSLQGEIATYQTEQTRLHQAAATLEAALSELNNQISQAETTIAENQTRYDEFANQITLKQEDVKRKANAVGVFLRKAYLEAGITPIEMLASSRTLSDYIDREEYRARLRVRAQEGLREVKATKKLLVTEQKKVKQVLRDGKAMRDTLVKKQKDQQDLLSRTRGQEAAYQQLAIQQNSNINRLRAEQNGANQNFFAGSELIAGDPNRGGYPEKWYVAPQDSLVDDWGLYNRECVSYTAWKVFQSGRRMPYFGGRGNANQWPASAQTEGITTGSTPRAGAVAIAAIGPYGHSMYVEEVRSDGKIRISEFNYHIDGTYTERIINASGLTYIYF
ncbi:MAG TPA: CHAP domain-containing protein [Candidatus Saccharimonadales bacterium]